MSHLVSNRTTLSRSGFTSAEVVVASTLLVAAIGVVGPLAVHTSRMWQESRHQQLAVEELSNQIEWLTALEEPARSEAMRELRPSVSLLHAAPSATISAATISDQDGKRIALKLDWNQPHRPRAAIELVSWIDPLPATEPAAAPVTQESAP